jgi:nicotinamidase-related amidase
MPVTALDLKTALVVIDLQEGLADYPTVHPFSQVVENATRLATAFRRANLPVVLVTVSFSADGGDVLRPRVDVRRQFTVGPNFARLMPALGPAPDDILITKRQQNAFYGTELDLQLRRRHVTGLVLCGVATGGGVDTTARAAYERGYNVTFASDAITDVDTAIHEVAMAKIFPRLGEVDTTGAILGQMG